MLRAQDPSDSTFAGSDFLDVAVGDLDRLPDSNGAYHDEVAVGWTTLESRNGSLAYVPHLAVLDYTDPAADPTKPLAVTSADASHWLNKSNIDSGSVYVNDNVVSIAVGDFDGDGTKEIALAVIESSTRIWVSIFRYTNDGAGNRTLTEGPAYAITTASDLRFTATVDLAAANVDGDLAGKDELLVGTVVRDTITGISQNVQLAVLQADSDLTLNQTAFFAKVGGTTEASSPWRRPKVQLVPGLFRFDPAHGFGFNRRQVAVFFQIYFGGSGVVNSTIFSVSDDLKTISPYTYFSDPTLNQDPAQRWTVAAGSYRGNKDASDPTWSPMLAVWHDKTVGSPT